MKQHPSGLSVSTGLAIETVVGIPRLDPNRSVPKMLYPISQYNAFYVNILTLIRNAISAYNADELPIVSGMDIAHFCSSEITILQSILPIPVQPYMSKYTHLANTVLKPFLRERTTAKQRLVDSLTVKATKAMLVPGNTIKQYVWTATGAQDNVLMLTHIILDLYSYHTFNTLTLLESNTGAVKSPAMFSSKYYKVDAATVPYIPFNLKTGLILGDSSVFKPMPIKVREQYLNAAVANKWSAVTPDSKIARDLKDIKYDLADHFFSNLPSF